MRLELNGIVIIEKFRVRFPESFRRIAMNAGHQSRYVPSNGPIIVENFVHLCALCVQHCKNSGVTQFMQYVKLFSMLIVFRIYTHARVGTRTRLYLKTLIVYIRSRNYFFYRTFASKDTSRANSL